MSFWFSRSSFSAFSRRNVKARGAACAAIFVVGFVASGCADQGEGERCDPLNYDQDCDDGLQCVELDTLRPGAEGAICCPPSNPTQNICRDATFNYADDAGESSSTSSPDANVASSSEPESQMSSADGGGTTEAGAQSDASPLSGPVSDAATTSSATMGSSATTPGSDAASLADSSPGDAEANR